MKRIVNIAMIDNGIDSEKLNFKLSARVTISEDGTGKCDDNCYDGQIFSHGTRCAEILKRSCDDIFLYSVRILNDLGIGGIEKLQPALEWCLQNEIYVINLSLGTTSFLYRNKIRKIINHYACHGMILVAASANSGYISFPCSFSNVIGVEAGEKFSVDPKKQIMKGIDVLAAICEYQDEYSVYKKNKSNSYAVPYVTAQIAKLMQEKRYNSVCEVRNKLVSYIADTEEQLYNPDWIENAWVSDKCKKSNATFYFTKIKENPKDERVLMDTVVLKNEQELKNYADYGKHIVYLGEEQVKNPSKNNYFWSPKTRKKQILCGEKRKGDIEVPFIVCKLDEQQDEILWLSELKRFFCEDGYNAFVISETVESILYDLEYLPRQMCNEKTKEQLHDFLYWQVYYNQSDLVLLSLSDDKNISLLGELIDLVIDVNDKDSDSIRMIAHNSGERIQEEVIDCTAGSMSKEIYRKILKNLTEDADE